MKKQFLTITGPTDLILSVNDGSTTETAIATVGNIKIYRFNDINFTTPKFSIQFRTAETNGTIKIN
jgi:hypothetical protein